MHTFGVESSIWSIYWTVESRAAYGWPRMLESVRGFGVHILGVWIVNIDKADYGRRIALRIVIRVFKVSFFIFNNVVF